MENNVQILRQAALEIQYYNSDLIKVAGIVNRIMNWWKAISNPEFKEQSKKVETAYDQLKGPVDTMISQFTDLDKAIHSQDIKTVTQLVEQVPSTIYSVIKSIEPLQKTIQDVKQAVPVAYVDEKGNELSTADLRRVTKEYKKNKELVQTLLNILPEEIKNEIPIGKNINRPISEFSWFNKYSPEDITTKPIVKETAKNLLVKSFQEAGLYNQQIYNIINQGFSSFIYNLYKAILERGILVRVDLADVSQKITYRSANQLWITINVDNVLFPWPIDDVFINIGQVKINDMNASSTRATELSIMNIKNIRVSPRSHKIIEQSMISQLPEEAVETESKIIEPIVESTVDKNADGPITKIVKRAIINNSLPITNAIIKINCSSFHHKVRFAKVLSSALRQEIEADSSVRANEHDILVQSSIRGSEMISLNAIYGISLDIASQFQKATNINIDIEVEKGITSYAMIESDVLDNCFNKVAAGDNNEY